MQRHLTKREAEVLSYISNGYTAKETAISLSLSPRTVEKHVDAMTMKLRARNRVHLVTLSLRAGLLPEAAMA